VNTQLPRRTILEHTGQKCDTSSSVFKHWLQMDVNVCEKTQHMPVTTAIDTLPYRSNNM